MITDTRANQILDAIHGVATLPAVTAPIRTRLMTVNGTGAAAGTELATAGGYTAGAGAPATTWGAASARSSATTAAVTVTNMPATTIVGVEQWDSAATPVRQEFGALTASKTTNAGDTFSIAAGQLTSAIN